MLNKLFIRTLYILIIAELLSLWSFLVPSGMLYIFIALCILFLYLTIKKLDYGLYIIFSELIIGSFGYLFWLEAAGFKISIRVAFWLIFMAVWFLKYLFSAYLKIRENNFKLYVNSLIKKAKSGVWPIFLWLLFFIFFGAVSGLINGNGFKNIFFDFNGWLYFLLIFPLADIFNHKEKDLRPYLDIFLISTIWLCFKTLALLFIFSHNLVIASEIYHWIRDTRVGEITRMEGGFFRIFLQSHIFVLPAFFVAFLLLIKNRAKGFKDFFSISKNSCNFFFLSLLSSVLILGFSRSNWVGFGFGLFVFYIFLIFAKKAKFKEIFRSFGILISSSVLGFILMTMIVNFPLPGSAGRLDTLSLITDRASEVSSEAGASSRWSLLPAIFKEIKKYPLLGKGFGSTVTYVSSDPRVREKNPSGEYTTFAFEWGWLDIWYKLGLVGLIVYLISVFYVLRNVYWQIWNSTLAEIEFAPLISFGFGIGLIAIGATSVFSPYMNHPLGISFFIFLSVLSSRSFVK